MQCSRGAAEHGRAESKDPERRLSEDARRCRKCAKSEAQRRVPACPPPPSGPREELGTLTGTRLERGLRSQATPSTRCANHVTPPFNHAAALLS